MLHRFAFQSLQRSPESGAEILRWFEMLPLRARQGSMVSRESGVTNLIDPLVNSHGPRN